MARTKGDTPGEEATTATALEGQCHRRRLTLTGMTERELAAMILNLESDDEEEQHKPNTSVPHGLAVEPKGTAATRAYPFNVGNIDMQGVL